MPKKSPMSLEDHLQMTDELAIVRGYFLRVTMRCKENFPRTGKLRRAVEKLHTAFEDVRYRLDAAYHEVTTEEEFHQYRHI